jgi:ribonuclease P/MRP protein subunit POP1
VRTLTQLQIGQTAPDEVIGFVSTGNISLTRGNGHGIATIRLEAYLKLLQVAEAAGDPTKVLCKVRNSDGVVYRLVSLSLVQ